MEDDTLTAVYSSETNMGCRQMGHRYGWLKGLGEWAYSYWLSKEEALDCSTDIANMFGDMFGDVFGDMYPPMREFRWLPCACVSVGWIHLSDNMCLKATSPAWRGRVWTNACLTFISTYCIFLKAPTVRLLGVWPSHSMPKTLVAWLLYISARTSRVM